ncbi:MAG: hypothetical protein ACO1OB_03165 [Archangium sp.]
MSPGDRTTLEAKIERHLRRGELSEAWAALNGLCEAFPEEDALKLRLRQLEESLEPSEWRRVTLAKTEPSGVHKSPMHYAEGLAAAGKYTEAIEIYRALLDERPDQELVKERLGELFQLAQVAQARRPTVDRAGVLEHLLERINARRRP